MKRIIFLFVFFFTALSLTHAAESEIILINSSAFVVELNDNFDVVRVIEELPNYFSEAATHEELLNAFVSNNSEKIDNSIGDITPRKCRSKSIVDISTIPAEPRVVFCVQSTDYQLIMTQTLPSINPILELYLEPKRIGVASLYI